MAKQCTKCVSISAHLGKNGRSGDHVTTRSRPVVLFAGGILFPGRVVALCTPSSLLPLVAL